MHAARLNHLLGRVEKSWPTFCWAWGEPSPQRLKNLPSSWQEDGVRGTERGKWDSVPPPSSFQGSSFRLGPDSWAISKEGGVHKQAIIRQKHTKPKPTIWTQDYLFAFGEASYTQGAKRIYRNDDDFDKSILCRKNISPLLKRENIKQWFSHRYCILEPLYLKCPWTIIEHTHMQIHWYHWQMKCGFSFTFM